MRTLLQSLDAIGVLAIGFVVLGLVSLVPGYLRVRRARRELQRREGVRHG